MKVQVTKVMAKLLNKEIPQFSFSVEEHTTGWWSDPTDYNPKTGRTKVLVVGYPPAYYAMPQVFTTKDLVQCFRRSDRSLEGFIQQVKDMVMI